jgi:uncharacterized membrane protein
MLLLIIGLALFLDLHFVRVTASQWRLAMIEEKGEAIWKGICSLLPIVGFVALV